MAIVITLSSIFAIALSAYALGKFSTWKICPICAGVAGTWLWMLAGMWTGLLPSWQYLQITAMLMGGSVVGIAYQTEKRFPEGANALAWKMFFIPSGFAAVYGVLGANISLALAGLFASLVILLVFLNKKGAAQAPNSAAKALAEKMKSCC